MREIPLLLAQPVPIPAPNSEPIAVIFPFMIERMSTADFPSSPYPLPMPEIPFQDELVTVEKFNHSYDTSFHVHSNRWKNAAAESFAEQRQEKDKRRIVPSSLSLRARRGGTP
jgi:hypothetical protein